MPKVHRILLAFLMLFAAANLYLAVPGVAFAQTSSPEQMDFRFPRGDARTLSFTTQTNVDGDSIKFVVTLGYQYPNSFSATAVLSRRSRTAFGGDDQQVFVRDSTYGAIDVYIPRSSTVNFTEKQYYYQLLVNDTTKFYGVISILPSNISATVTSIDTTGFRASMFTRMENTDAGKAGADSVSTQLTLIKNLIAGKAGADSVHSALVVLYNLVAGKAGADSVYQQLALLANGLAGKAGADSVHTVLTTFTGNVTTLQNQMGGKAGADSVALQFVLVKNLIAGKAGADSINAALLSLFNIVAGKAGADSVHTQLARIIDSLAAHRTLIDAKVPHTRTISTTAPLIGGGDLTANRTFYINPDSLMAYRQGATINGVSASSFKIPTLLTDTTGGYWAIQDSNWIHRDSMIVSPTLPGVNYRFIEVNYKLWGRSAYAFAWSVNADSANNARILDVRMELRSFRDPMQATNVHGSTGQYAVGWTNNGGTLNKNSGSAMDASVPVSIMYAPLVSTTVTLYTWLVQGSMNLSEAVFVDVRILAVIPSTSNSLYGARINGW